MVSRGRVDRETSSYRPAKVRLSSYDQRWPELYVEEAERLAQVIGPQLVAIEHIGSTSIPGMTAKPIIDILAAVPNFHDFPSLVCRLEALDYLYTPHTAADDSGWRVFRKGPVDMSQLRTHHLHVTEANSYYWRRITAFRDYLRAHPAEAAAYVELKRRLAATYEGEPRRYTASKAEFVRAIERKAGIGLPIAPKDSFNIRG